jgi:hypothetical protein
VVHSTQLAPPSEPEGTATIATTINRILASRGLSVQVKSRAECLKILLEGESIPDKQRWVPFLTRLLSRLELPAVERVYVYGRRTSSPAIVWSAILPLRSLGNKADPSLAAQPISPQLLSSSLSMPRMVAPFRAAVSSNRLSVAKVVMSPEDIFLEKIKEEIIQIINAPEVWIDLELEGLDLLITLETRQNMSASGLLPQLKTKLKAMDLGRIKLVRLYQRHPRTQQSIPLQEILIKALTMPSRKASPVKLTPPIVPMVDGNTLIMVSNEAEPAQLELNSEFGWQPEALIASSPNQFTTSSWVQSIERRLAPFLNSRLGRWSIRVGGILLCLAVLQQIYYHAFVLQHISLLWVLAGAFCVFGLWRGLIALRPIIRSYFCK